MEYAAIFLPLIGSIISYFAKIIGNLFSQIFSSLLVTISAIISIYIFYEGIVNNNYGNYLIFEWINSGNFKVNWSINIDPLSAIMIMVVTSVSAIVHIYSIGYMSFTIHINPDLCPICLYLLFQCCAWLFQIISCNYFWLGRCWFMFLFINWFLV